MNEAGNTVLVFGATGQQGGSVAAALRERGWPVRAMVRDPGASGAASLRALGVEVVRGDFADEASVRAATAGVWGVFSVQPSSGQGALYGVSDEDEVRFGTRVADIALESGVRHLVYASANAVREDTPSGLGHFDSKARIEAYLRTLPLRHTVLRPAAFMEILLMPGFGLPEGCFRFFMRPDQPMQFVAVRDIGRVAAAVFAAPDRFRDQAIELAGDAITGDALAAQFSALADRPIRYGRFPDAVLAANPFLAALTRLVENGRLTGQADLAALRGIEPDLLRFGDWLTGPGRDAFRAALSAGGDWDYGPGKTRG